MIHAYDEQYLDDAMKNLGEAMDYAVHKCQFTADQFLDVFVTSGMAERFGNGEPKLVSGLSGSELVLSAIEKAGMEITIPDISLEYDYSPEYWCGWILAYYQWYTGRNFLDIHTYITMERIIELYPTLHEAPEIKFVNVVNHIIRNSHPISRLQVQRKLRGLTQKELSKKSGVSLRSIQQYEQFVKDINKASVINVIALARTLGCHVEDLIEYEIEEV